MSAIAAGDPPQRTIRDQPLRPKTLLVGSLIVALWIVCAVFGASIAPYDAAGETQDVLARPGVHHLFGTDQLGRDVLSRVLVGAGHSLTVALAATLVAVVAGTAIGLVAGYYRGTVDQLISRVSDAVLSLPLIVLAIVVVTALDDSSATLALVVGIFFATAVSRTVRAAVLAERELDYVPSARLRGEGAPYILFAEVLPNVMGPIIVEATTRFGYAIFTLAGLAFLGFGADPSSPDWATQVADNYGLLASGTYWWTVLFPGLAIASVLIAINLIAEGISRKLES